MVTRNFNLFLNSGIATLLFHANQYDTNEQWVFTLYESDGTQFVPQSGEIVGLRSTRQEISQAGTVVDGKVVINVTEDIVNAAGRNEFELILNNSHRTANFIVIVKASTVTNRGYISDSDLEAVYQAIALGVDSQVVSELVEDVNSIEGTLAAESTARSSGDAALSTRIDNIVAQAGTDNTEVVDIRLKADGTTAATAGNAVREQVTALDQALSQNEKVISRNDNVISTIVGWQQGRINPSSGGTGSSSYNCRTNSYTSFADGKITFTVAEGFDLAVYKYDASHTYIGVLFNFTSGTKSVIVSGEFTYRFCVKKTDDSTIAVADLPTPVVSYSLSKFIYTDNAVQNTLNCIINDKTKSTGSLSGWQQGTYNTTTGSGVSSAYGCRVRDITFTHDAVVIFNIAPGFSLAGLEYSDLTYLGLSFYYEANHIFCTVKKSNNYRFTISYNNFSEITPSDIPADAVTYDIYYDETTEYAETDITNAINPLRIAPFYDHLLMDKTNGNNVIIPCQSIPALEMSRRLGFVVTEVNTNLTSDGDYLVIHGNSGAFGNQVEHVDGITDISETLINSVSMAWIKANVRYKSLYEKYRTAPSSLSEYLVACKINNLIPMIQFRDAAQYEIANAIMGKDNFIAYNGSRGYTSALIMTATSSLNSKEEILARCESYGKPYMHCMTSFGTFTDAELLEIVDSVHNAGYLIGIAGNYMSQADVLKAFKLGFDFSSSKYQVNNFENGNICNLTGDLLFTDFTTTGTVENGIITLNANDTITPDFSFDSLFLSKGILSIRFSGTINVVMGNFINDSITSDGSQVTILSTYYINQSQGFTITASDTTEIYAITYKVSKC